MILDFFIRNKELLKLLYGVLLTIVCAGITLKTDRLFKISDHQGIRYFRNSFLFYGLAFFIRFIAADIGSLVRYFGDGYNIFLLHLFKFIILMAGFFLVYSMIWKHVEKEKSFHSFINIKVLLFSILSILIIVIDLLLKTNVITNISQIIVFLFLSVLAFVNFRNDGNDNKFLKYYFLNMSLGLIAWIINLIAIHVNNPNNILGIIAYFIDTIFFLFFAFILNSLKKRME